MLRFLLMPLAVLIHLSLGAPVGGRDSQPLVVKPHVRPVDPQLREVLSDAAHRSITLRRLLDRLEASDLVVYLEFDPFSSCTTTSRLSFIVSAGGTRYVRVDMCRRLTRWQLAGAIGHELRHAVELAEADQVIDSVSMARFYRRSGLQMTGRAAGSYESIVAIEDGRTVEQDVRRGD